MSKLPPVAPDDPRWEAVQSRDSRFDGAFVYGVLSTHIYCKPSCPSRRPRREKVSFFTCGAGAKANGFRACLRCRPDESTSSDPRIEMALRVCRAIEAHANATPTLCELGAELGVSSGHLQRMFKDVTGVTPRQYAAALRLDRFKAKVRNGHGIAAAMYDAGYGSSSRLYEKATEHLGMTPAAYRRGGRGLDIIYTTVGCTLGRLLIAATERGVCAVSFGDDDEELKSGLMAEYPQAVLRCDDANLARRVDEVLRHVEGGIPRLDLPLDLRASAFQLRVWEALRQIPYGETRSYGEVAKAIGKPAATRAVARACAANPVALVTPCHRVVRKGGEIGGYKWGIERKARLLEREQRCAGGDGAREGK